jgi:hypothetical protein
VTSYAVPEWRSAHRLFHLEGLRGTVAREFPENLENETVSIENVNIEFMLLSNSDLQPSVNRRTDDHNTPGFEPEANPGKRYVNRTIPEQ